MANVSNCWVPLILPRPRAHPCGAGTDLGI